MRAWAVLLLLALLPLGAGAESLDVCYNYGCSVMATVEFSPRQLENLRAQLARAGNASSERLVLAEVIGRMYRMAGAQTPIWRDKGGNSEDDEVEGRMDCIDHSTTTTHFLELLAARGWLRFHNVLPRQMRRRHLIFEHWTALLEVREGGELFAVDSWFFDHGDGAAVLPFTDWLEGRDPEIRHWVAEALQEQMERQVSQ
ncbi:MAG TPA: hypothetical protein VFK74_05070 [Azospira sp.]|nr:hypothetical protein [Azospira sp.]